MPIYEYRCKACGHTLESLQKFSDAPLVECPHCHQPDLTKIVSLVGFQLKGSGWYVTDFRNSGAKPAAKPGDAAAGNSDDGATKRPGADADGGTDGNGSRSGADKPAASSGSESATSGSDTTGKADSTSSGSKPADGGTSTGSAASTGPGSSSSG